MDQLYYESGYVVDGYYVYTADAESAQSSAFAVTAVIGVIKNGAAEMTSTFTQTSTISHIYGADLFAFTEAALAVEVSRIRDNNIAVSAAFTIATDASRTRTYSSEDSAAFDLVAINLRVRFEEAAVSAAFSMSAAVDIIPGGTLVEAEAALSSSFDINLQNEWIRDVTAALASSFSQDITAVRNQFFTSDITANTEVAISPDLFKDMSVELMSSAAVSIPGERIIQAASTENSAFSPSLTVTVFKNSFAVLDSTANLSAIIKTTKSLNVDLISTTTLTISGVKLSNFWYNVYEPSYTTGFAVYSVAVNSQKEVIFATMPKVTYNGSVYSGSTIVKVDKYGNTIWSKTLTDLSTTAGKFIRDIKVDSNDNIIVSTSTYATTYFFTPGNTLFKLDTNANVIWQKTFSNKITGILALDSTDNIYTAASRETIYTYLSKFDTDGNTVWKKHIVGTSPSYQNTSPTSLFIDSNNDIHLSTNLYNTSTNTSSGGSYIKIRQSDMTKQIEKITPGSSGSIQVIPLDNGSYYFYNPYSIELIKFNSIGGVEWNITNFPGGNIVLDNVDNGLLVSVTNRLYKFSDSGSLVWAKNLSHTGYTITRRTYSENIAGTIDDTNSPIIDSTRESIYVQYSDYTTNASKGSIAKLPLNGSGSIDSPIAYSNVSFTPTISYTANGISDSNYISITNATWSTTTNSSYTLANISLSNTQYPVSGIGYYKTANSNINTFAILNANGIKTFGIVENLASTATLSVDINKSVVLSLVLQSTASVQCDISRIKSFTIDIQSNGFLVAATGRIRPFVDIEVSTFTATVVASKTVSESSSLSSTVDLTSTADRLMGPITAALESQSSISAATDITRTVEASINSEGFLVAATGRIRPFADIEVSTFNLIADSQVVKVAEAAIAADANLTAVATRLMSPIVVNITATTSLSALGAALPSGTVNMSATANITVAADRIRGADSAQSVTAALAAQARNIHGGVIAADSTATVSALVYKIKQFNADLSALAFELAIVSKTGNVIVDMPAAAQLSATSKITTGSVVDAVVETSLTATGVANKPVAASLLTSTEMTTDGDAGIIGEVNVTATTGMSTTAVTVQTVQANIQSESTLIATAGRIRPGISLEWGEASLTATVGVIKQAVTNVQSQASMTTGATRKVSGVASLQCQGFSLIVARVLNLEASITYRVPAERTVWRVRPEQYIWTVESENRSYKIKG